MLSTLLSLRVGYVYVPCSFIESAIGQNKDAYHGSLRLTQNTIRSQVPDWQPWLSFFLKSLTRPVPVTIQSPFAAPCALAEPGTCAVAGRR